MNPFLEVPVITEETKIETSGFFRSPKIVTQEKQETLRLRPGEIETYQSDGENVHLIMKSGKEHFVTWSFDMFDQALVSYNNTINSKENKGKFGNVAITQKPDKVALKPVN